METEPVLPPDTSLNVLGSAVCPVCAAPLYESSDRIVGVETMVVHEDRDVLEHLVLDHSPGEVALAWLVAEARLTFARQDMAPDTAARYDAAVVELGAARRAELLG